MPTGKMLNPQLPQALIHRHGSCMRQSYYGENLCKGITKSSINDRFMVQTKLQTRCTHTRTQINDCATM